MAAPEGRRRGGSLGFIIGVVVAIPATVFALSNLEPATVEFLGWQAEVPLWLVIAASVLAGVVIGAGLMLATQGRRRRARKKRAKAAETRGQEQARAGGPTQPEAEGQGDGAPATQQ